MLAGDVVAPALRGRPAWAVAAGRRFAGDVARCLACITRARFVAVQPARGAILPHFRTRKAATASAEWHFAGE